MQQYFANSLSRTSVTYNFYFPYSSHVVTGLRSTTDGRNKKSLFLIEFPMHLILDLLHSTTENCSQQQCELEGVTKVMTVIIPNRDDPIRANNKNIQANI